MNLDNMQYPDDDFNEADATGEFTPEQIEHVENLSEEVRNAYRAEKEKAQRARNLQEAQEILSRFLAPKTKNPEDLDNEDG